MAGPRRVQRRIFKGWRLPPDTVYVGRGSKWGNPFPFGHQVYLGKPGPGMPTPSGSRPRSRA